MKLYYAAALLFIVLVCSCSNGNGKKTSGLSGDTLTSRSELLTLVDCGDFVAAEVADPWNEGKILARYALIGRDKPVPEEIGDDYVVVTVPLRRSIVYSSTNSSAIGELGALGSIAAVADGTYYAPTDTVAKLIASGKIVDIGNSASPKPETIVDVEPDAILVSPYQNAGHGVVGTLGVPVVDCADYMETTPLGRTEWILLLGELYGNRQLARDIYAKVTADYEALCRQVAESDIVRPKVITEVLTSGVWYVPGGKSYMARMLMDAGAEYPWADDSSAGSLQLDMASVLDRASDADIWIMRNFGVTPTRRSLLDISPLNARFKAFETGEIYNCDTSVKPVFNDIAFHPERVLLDFILMFHPGMFDGLDTVYYEKIPAE